MGRLEGSRCVGGVGERPRDIAIVGKLARPVLPKFAATGVERRVLVASSNRLCTEMTRWSSILPLHSKRLFVVLTEVSQEPSLQIRDGSKYASRDDVALDLAEPHLDLLQPRRAGRSEVQPMTDDRKIPLVDVQPAIRKLSRNGLLGSRSNAQAPIDAVVSMGRRNTQLEPTLHRKQELKSLAR